MTLVYGNAAWQNHSQAAGEWLSVDGHIDGPDYIISQQNNFLHGENIKNEMKRVS